MTQRDPLRRETVLQEVEDFTTEYGHPPSVRDLLPRVGLSSTSAVHHHVRRLVKEGRLRYCECGCHRVFADASDPSGPGVAYITGSDTPADVDRKIADAFAPVDGILAAFAKYMGD